MDRSHDAVRPLDTMCADILERYHAALHTSLPGIHERLTALATECESSAVEDVQKAFDALTDQIQAHLAKEENLLFPAIEALAGAERARAGRPVLAFATVLYPIRAMEAEHVRIAAALDRLEDLVFKVTAPDSQSAGWRACVVELAALDAALREHHDVEDQQLFPAALDLERRLLSLG